MIGGWVLFLAGALSGIIVFGLVIIFAQYVQALNEQMRLLRTEISNVTSYYNSTKNYLSTEFDELRHKIGRLDKKMDDYKPLPIETGSKSDTGDIGNRSV